MLPVTVLALSIILQFVAAVLALSLIRITRQRIAWILIAIALALMTVRRAESLVRLLLAPAAAVSLGTFDVLGLLVSILMVVVFLYIGRYFFDVFTTERTLRQSEERYRTLAQHIPGAAVFLFDMNRRVILAEGPLLAQPPFPKQPRSRMPFHQSSPTEELMEMSSALLDVAMGGREVCAVREHEGRTFSIKVVPVRDPNGGISGSIALALDVTAEITAEKERAVAYDFLQHTIDGVAEPIMVIDPDYKVTLMNQVVRERYTQAGSGDLLCYRISHHRDTPCNGRSHPCPVAMVRERLVPVTVTHQHQTASGELRQVEIMASPLLSESGQLLGVIEASRDITERERALETVRKLSQAVEQSPTSVMITDMTGAIEYVNPKFTQLTGYTLEHVRGKSPSMLGVGQTAPEEFSRLLGVLRTGQLWKGEFVSKKKNGEPYWESATISPVRDEQGTLTHLVAVKEDISERRLADERLRESEARYRAISELTSDYTFSAAVGVDGSIAANWVAGAFQMITGYTWEEFIAIGSWPAIVYPEDRGFDMASRERLLANETISTEMRIVRKGGEVRWVHNYVRPIWNPREGRVVELIGAVQDIHERKQAEQTLRESETRHRAISELTSDYTFSSRIEADGRVVQNWISGAFRRITGYDIEEFEAVGGWQGIVYADDRPQEREDMHRLLSNRAINNTIRIVRKDEAVRWIERQVRPIWDAEQGRVVAQIGAVRDVTERMQAEKFLQESEEKFSKAFRASPVPLAIVRLMDNWIIEVNGAFERLTGYRREEAVGKSETELRLWVNATEQERARVALVTEGQVQEQEYAFRTKAGDDIVCRYAAEMIDIQGQRCALLTMVDLTETRRAEAALRTLSRAVEQSSASIVITDPSGLIEYVNPYFSDLTGYTSEESMGKNPRFLKSGRTPPEEYARLWNTITSGEIWRGEFCNRKKNGELFWESASIAPVLDPSGVTSHFVAVKEDITLRKQAEEKSRRHTKDLEDLANLSAAMRGAETRSEIYPVLLQQLAELMHAGGAAIVMRDRTSDRFVCALGYLSWEGLAGRELPHDLDLSRRVLANPPADSGAEPATGADVDWESLFAGQNHVACMPLIAHGDTIGALWLGRPEAMTESEMRLLDAIGDMAANAIQRQSLLEDLEVQLDAVRTTQARLVQSEKLAAIGLLLSGVAHELNNPLTSVVLYSQLVQQEKLDQQAKCNLDKVVAEALRAGKIVRSLLDFARQRPLDRRIVQVNAVVENCVDLVAYELKAHKISFELELDRALPKVMADAHQLEQVLVNLINNAWQAMSQSQGRGRLKIMTESGRSEYTMSPGDDRRVARLRIIDDGPGIAPADLSRVFDPFFTTRPEGGGTGLGLSICHGIINEHGGHVWAESDLGKGSTFTIELPIAPEEAEAAEGMGPVGGSESRPEENRILILDDEPNIRDVLSQALRRRGYLVDASDNGADGLSRLAKAEYDFILCDIRMPEFSGLDFYRHLKAHDRRSADKVIFITGDTVSAGTRKFIEENGVRQLAKPFELAEVLEMLRPSSVGRDR